MHPRLSRAIVEQYRTFERPAPRRIAGCPCCASPELLAALVTLPLRELTYEQLGVYATSAISTVGSVEDFRYLWPRIAELLVTVPPGQLYADAEIVIGKLRDGGWEAWPERERASVQRFLRALLERLADEPLDAPDVDSWVCAVGQATDDLVAWLEPLLAGTPAARHNLRGFHEWNRGADGTRGVLANAFWTLSTAGAEVVNANVEPVVEWLSSAEVSRALGEAYGADGRREG